MLHAAPRCSSHHRLCAGTWQPLQLISSHAVQHFLKYPQPSRSQRYFLQCLTYSVHCFHSCVSPHGVYNTGLPRFAFHVFPSFALSGCFASLAVLLLVAPAASGMPVASPPLPPSAAPVVAPATSLSLRPAGIIFPAATGAGVSPPSFRCAIR